MALLVAILFIVANILFKTYRRTAPEWPLYEEEEPPPRLQPPPEEEPPLLRGAPELPPPQEELPFRFQDELPEDEFGVRLQDERPEEEPAELSEVEPERGTVPYPLLLPVRGLLL